MGKNITSRKIFVRLWHGLLTVAIITTYLKQPEMACFSDLTFSMPMF